MVGVVFRTFGTFFFFVVVVVFVGGCEDFGREEEG